MSVQTAPCRWPADFTDCADLTTIEGSGDPEMYVGAATEYLWNWTGRRYGLCDVTVRPCRQDCTTAGMSTFFGNGPVWPNAAPFTPVIINGGWYNLSCGRCGDVCGCGHIEQLQLPGPIYSIDSITIDGEVLPSGNYRVDNDKWLVRTDDGSWPSCQDLSADVGEEDTFEIVYRKGVPVPVGGQIAAGVLATELAKALCNDGTCQLPQRVQSITRQGVTIAMLDAFDDVEKGHTGIWVVDSWIASIMKSPKPSRVISPDLHAKVRRTTWGG